VERLLIVRRADQMVIPATRVVPVEFRLDPGRNDLDFETLLLGGVIARDEPVQSEHRLGAFDHELRAITNHRRHCFALLVLSSRNGADISGLPGKCLQYSLLRSSLPLPPCPASPSGVASPNRLSLSQTLDHARLYTVFSLPHGAQRGAKGSAGRHRWGRSRGT